MHLPFRVLLVLSAAALRAAAAVLEPTITEQPHVPGTEGGTATLRVTVKPNGGLTEVFAEYGKATNAYTKTTASKFLTADSANTAVLVSIPLSGLLGGQTYYYRIVAQNSAGPVSTPENAFTTAPFAPVLTVEDATKVINGKATLKAKLTANGQVGTAFFEYAEGTTVAEPTTASDQTWDITGQEDAVALSAELTGLDRDKPFAYRLTFHPTDGDDAFSGTKTFFTNVLPVAKPDILNITGRRPSILDVLKNDSDADTDDTRTITAVSTVANGVAVITLDASRIVYDPGEAFRGTDTFTYTLSDGHTAATPVTATVTLRAFGVLLRGNHGGVLVDENGNAIGYFKIAASESGAFTGTVLVDGEKESISGVIGPDGKFRGTVKIDGENVALALNATQSGTGTTLDVDFDSGRWTSSARTTEASPAERARRAGRYTVEFPGGTSTGDAANSGSEPAGTGWAELKLSENGVARIKGRLPDGRSFSTSGVLGIESGGTVITFFDDPKRTRVAGTLTLGTTVSGALRVAREEGGSGLFADGFNIQRTAGGARYGPPADGKRAIEGTGSGGRKLSLAVASGDAAETFTRELRVDSRDKVTVVDRDSEALKVKIDRGSGRFTVSFTGSSDDQRIKGTGVFIQGTSSSATGRGAGVFTGENGTGRITITASSGTTSRPPTPPPTTPPPTTVTTVTTVTP